VGPGLSLSAAGAHLSLRLESKSQASHPETHGSIG